MKNPSFDAAVKSGVVALPDRDEATTARLLAAAALPDDQIDLTDPDAPEVVDWSGTVRGRFPAPVKKRENPRTDADVLAFFQAQGPGYRTRINSVRRDFVLQQSSPLGRESA
jgi:uncharacterized protein (DUF4415 family)